MSSENLDDDIASLLGNLALKDNGQVIDDKSGQLQRELNVAGFRIFECLCDKGFFSWNSPHGAPYRNVGSIASSDQLMISSYLDLDGRPDSLVDPRSIRTPKAFLFLEPHETRNKFPHGNIEIISLHVAARFRGVDFADVDFVFGGSTLEMLATCDAASDPFMVTIVPGTKTIMVVKNKDYTKNASDLGFQFERLMTGKAMDDMGSMESTVEHLHTMNVGPYHVLFRAETDAIDDGSPVEIKASNPRYWGTKVMFQMISSGSTKLCHGKKGRGSLTGVSNQSLQHVAQTALAAGLRVRTLERNIEKGMESIRDQTKEASPGDVFKVSFQGVSLKLLPARGRSADILPQADVTKELILG
jgi:hypothetical protein